MAIIFTNVIVPIMLAIISIFDPMMPECSRCDSTGFVICEKCGGAEKSEIYCAECNSEGHVICPDCPDYAQFYHAFKANLEEYTK